MTDYHAEYLKGAEICGPIFPEFERFLSALRVPSSVLDLGCGQGRDAMVAARLGHHVTAVDLALSGIEQLRLRAKQEGLDVAASVADIQTYSTTDRFDVVILDRVLHMLPSPEAIRPVLRSACSFTNLGGWVMVADTRRNRPLIRDFFEQRGWPYELRSKDFTICRKPMG